MLPFVKNSAYSSWLGHGTAFLEVFAQYRIFKVIFAQWYFFQFFSRGVKADVSNVHRLCPDDLRVYWDYSVFNPETSRIRRLGSESCHTLNQITLNQSRCRDSTTTRPGVYGIQYVWAHILAFCPKNCFVQYLLNMLNTNAKHPLFRFPNHNDSLLIDNTKFRLQILHFYPPKEYN